MEPNLTHLIELQKLDERLEKLRRAHIDIPNDIKRLQKDVARHQQHLQAAEEVFAAQRKALRQYELNEQSESERLGKTQGRLLTCKTNDEYRASMAEIDYLKQHCSELETRILEGMEQVEEAQRKVQEVRGEVQREVQRLEAIIEEKQLELDGLGPDLRGAQAQRSEVAAAVDAAWLKAYDKVRANLPGLTVTRVEHETCLGCNMSLPPQFVQEIRLNNLLFNCPHCMRILYYDDEQTVSEK